MPKIPYKVMQNEPVILEVEVNGAPWRLIVLTSVHSVISTDRTLADGSPELQVTAGVVISTKKVTDVLG